MAYTEYILPNANTEFGLCTVRLYSEFDDLTVPLNNTIEVIGEVDDSVDVSPSVQEAAVLDITLFDDRTIYTEGFWFKVLDGDALLKIMILEGEVETFYFFGVVEPLQVEWEEDYADPTNTTIIRRAAITLTSLVKKLFDVTSQDLQDAVYNNRIPCYDEPTVGGDPFSYFRVKDIFARMLELTGLNSGYNGDDVTFLYDSAHLEFKFKNAAGDSFRFDQLFFVPSTLTTPPGGMEQESYFFQGTSQWANTFYYLKDFISILLNSFQLILRFDFSDSRVRINLCQRGHAYTSNVTMPKTIKNGRKIVFASDKRLDGVSTSDYFDSNTHRFLSRQFSTDMQTIDPPSYVTINVDKQILFRAGKSATFVVHSLIGAQMLFGQSISTEEDLTDRTFLWTDMIRTIEYFNSESKSYLTTNDNFFDLGEAVCGYLFYRFSPKFKVIRTIHATLKVNDGITNSQANAMSLMRTPINYGKGDKQFYATQVIKNSPEPNKMTVFWFEE